MMSKLPFQPFVLMIAVLLALGLFQPARAEGTKIPNGLCTTFRWQYGPESAEEAWNLLDRPCFHNWIADDFGLAGHTPMAYSLNPNNLPDYIEQANEDPGRFWLLGNEPNIGTTMKELEGKIIQEVWIDQANERFLMFQTDQGLLAYEAEGDCCSESWFYHVLGVDNLIGQRVLEIEHVDLGEPLDGFSRQDVDELYGVKIKTERGWADVEFRNSSNGYYGGWLSLFPCESPQALGTGMVQLTEDYTADLVMPDYGEE